MTLRITKELVVGLLVAGIVLSSGCADDDSPFARERHSVVLIDVGGASANALERLAGDRSTLASIGSSMADFQFAFAQAAEPRPALASLLSGLYPGTHGVKGAENRLDESIVTLPQAFAEAGFATAAFSTAGDLGEGSGLDRGFTQSTRASGEKLTAALTSFLDQSAREPFFLMLHTDLGYALGSTQRAQKLGQRLAAFDETVQFLKQELNQRGLIDSTTILITSDRGIAFDDSPEDDEGAADATTALKRQLASTRIPFLLSTPGLSESRSILSSVEIVDVMPTLLDLAGVEVPGLVQGESLRRLLEGSAQERFIAFSELRGAANEPGAAVALAGFQLVQVGDQPPQLFDLRQNDAVDLASAEPQKVEVLRYHLDSWRQQMASGLAGAQIIGSEELDALQDLGYIQ